MGLAVGLSSPVSRPSRTARMWTPCSWSSWTVLRPSERFRASRSIPRDHDDVAGPEQLPELLPRRAAHGPGAAGAIAVPMPRAGLRGMDVRTIARSQTADGRA